MYYKKRNFPLELFFLDSVLFSLIYLVFCINQYFEPTKTENVSLMTMTTTTTKISISLMV